MPALVEGLNDIVLVTAGDSHTAALTDDGKVFAWGNFRVSMIYFKFILYSPEIFEI